MEEKLTGKRVLAAAGVLAAVAFGLRLHQLHTAFDVVGARPGAGFSLFTVVTVLAVLAFGAYGRTLPGRKKYSAISSTSLPLMIASAVGALLLAVGSILQAVGPQQDGDLLMAAFGFATAVCWGAVAAGRYAGKKVPALWMLLPVVYYVVALVCQFRFWTRDPVILDYCYELFALISTMCALFHLSGYCFDEGHRRVTVFFCLCGIFFSAAAMAGAKLSYVLVYLAAVVWLGGNLWLLLRPGKKQNAEKE